MPIDFSSRYGSSSSFGERASSRARFLWRASASFSVWTLAVTVPRLQWNRQLTAEHLHQSEDGQGRHQNRH